MIVSLLVFIFTILLGIICFLVITFYLLFKYSPKTPPPVPTTSPLIFPKSIHAPAFVSDWFNEIPLNEVSSLCIVQIHTEETSAVMSTDGEFINLAISTQLARIPLKSVQIKNVSFSGRKMSKKNFMRVIGEDGPIFKKADVVQIRFKYSYELEYWDKLLVELCEIAHGQRSSQMARNGIGRKQHRLLAEQMLKNEQGLGESDRHWSSTVNMLLQLFSYPFISNTDLHNLIKNKVNELFSLEISPDLVLNSFNFGNNVPYIKNPKVQCGDEPGAIIIDGILDYTGPIGASVSFDFKLLNLKIQLSFYVTSLVGDVRVRILKIPSNTLWFAFHELPKINISYDLRVGNFVCNKFPIIEQYIIETINAAILETCYSPKMFPIPIPNFSMVDHLKEMSSEGTNEEEKKETVVEDKKEEIKEVVLIESHTEPPKKEAEKKIKINEPLKTSETTKVKELKQEEKETTKEVVEEKTPIPNKMIIEGKIRIPQNGALDKKIEPHKPKELELFFDKEEVNRVYENFIKQDDIRRSLKKQPPSLPKKEVLAKSLPPLPPKQLSKEAPTLPEKHILQNLPTRLEPPKKQLPSLPTKPEVKPLTEAEVQTPKDCPPLPAKDRPTTPKTKPELPPKGEGVIN